jgi:hypothetical protein
MVFGVFVQTVAMVTADVGSTSMVLAVVARVFLVGKIRAKDSASSFGSSNPHLLK